MSKKILLAVLTAFSLTAISGAAGAAETSLDREPIAREHSSVPDAPEYRFQEESLPHAFGGQRVESENNHVAKTGLLSGIKKIGGAVKSAAKKVGSAVKTAGKAVAKGTVTAAKRIGAGYKNLAKDIANTTVAKKIVSGVKTAVKKAKDALKKLPPPFRRS